MSDHRVDRLLDAWLDLGPEVAPDYVHHAVAMEVRTTPQAAPDWRHWAAGRVPSMNAFARLALATAAVVLIAVLGIRLLASDDGLFGSDGPSASPSSPDATTLPTASPTPGTVQKGAPYIPRMFSWPGSSWPGRYAHTVDGVQFSFEVPELGWESNLGHLIGKSAVGNQSAEAIIYWSRYPEGIAADAVACQTWAGRVAAGEASLADAVSTAPGVELVDPPSRVTVGGLDATYVVVSVRERLGCDPGYFFSWTAPIGGANWLVTEVGTTLQIWIFDMEPAPLLMIAETNTDATPSLSMEIDQIVSSIEFE